MVNLKDIIDEELRKRFSEARAAGSEYLDVISGIYIRNLVSNTACLPVVMP